MSYRQCPKCFANVKLTRHHIFPTCFKFRHANKDMIMLICDKCHIKLERFILQEEDKEFYRRIQYGVNPYEIKRHRFPKYWHYYRVINNFLGYKKYLC